MIDSLDVLGTLKVAYTVYALVILSLFAWFALRVTRGETKRLVSRGIFYAYIGALVFVGVTLHILTFKQIPWVALDLKRDQVAADVSFEIAMEGHEFKLPADKLVIPCDKVVKFDVESRDLTYGFGLFRANHSMVFQMQVVPGSDNVLAWRFHKNGRYDIRSTEYSGPKGARMLVKGAVEVVGCKETDEFAGK